MDKEGRVQMAGLTWNWTMLEWRRDMSRAISRQNASLLGPLASFSTFTATGLTPFIVAFSTCESQGVSDGLCSSRNSAVGFIGYRFEKPSLTIWNLFANCVLGSTDGGGVEKQGCEIIRPQMGNTQDGRSIITASAL